MNKITNFGRFYSALKYITLGDDEMREEFKARTVSEFTNGRTTSLREVTWNEYKAICEALEKLTGRTAIKDVMKQKRSTCLHQMQLSGIDTTDWSRINAFCMDKRICGKMFREMDGNELDAVTVKIRAIMRKDVKALEGIQEKTAKIVTINN